MAQQNKKQTMGWFCRTESSEVSLWESLKNSHWNLLRRLQNANQASPKASHRQFVEMLPTSYIFKSRAIHNKTSKIV